MAGSDRSLRRRLTGMMLGTAALVLGVTCAAFLLYELATFRSTAIRQLSTLGKAIATNSTAALAFQNPEDATGVLSALRADPDIVIGVLYDDAGGLFASFPSPAPSDLLPAAIGADGSRLEHGRLVDVEPVLLDGTTSRLGTLYLVADLAPLYARIRTYGLIALLVIAASMLLAYALAGRLQRQITRPVLALAEVAQAVSQRRDYSVRAPSLDGGELGLLTDAFNHMLGQIGQSEAGLRSQLGRLNLLDRLTRAIGERQDLPSVFRVVIGTLEGDLPIDFGCVCLYDAARETLTVTAIGTASYRHASALGIAEERTIATEENGLARCLRGDLVYEPDTSQVAADFPRRLSGADLRSAVFAPLMLETNVFGILIATRRQANAFSSADCEFLRQLSEHVALAAHQTQIHTALQQAYDDLRQSQHTVMEQERLRALGQMASGIAHDINNAISPVALYVEALLDNEPLSKTAREYLQTIDRAVGDVAGTVARMREFYRQREPQIALAPAAMNGLVQQVLDLTRVRWRDMPLQRGTVIELRTEMAEGLPEVMVAEGEVRDALTNLVFNAVDAMPDGGTLTVRTSLRSVVEAGAPVQEVDVSVSDTGIGMDEETRQRCLEPFFTTKGERGTGLGLAMVYGMVQRHSASLDIESGLGRGTTVRLRFAVGMDGAAGADQPTERGAIVRQRILVVDDDPVLLKALCDALQGDGHTVTTANGGREGVEAFRTALRGHEPFGVVITDLGMPYMDGRQVAAEVKKASPSTPVIMLTGWGQRLLAEGEIPPNVDRLLSKPPKMAVIREALTRLATKAA